MDDNGNKPEATISSMSPASLGLEMEGEGKEGLALYYIAAAFCVTMGALASGLTMGLLNLDKRRLQIQAMTAKTEEESRSATRLMPLIEDHHRLLVTLLLANAIAAEALPLFLDEIFDPLVAVLMSVSFVLICGEIIPAAIFTGPNQVVVAANLAPLVDGLLMFFSPIAVPVALVLDCIFGKHSEHEEPAAHRSELVALMNIHQSELMTQLQTSSTKTDPELGLGNVNTLSTIQSYDSMGTQEPAQPNSPTRGGSQGMEEEDVGLDQTETRIVEGILKLHHSALEDVAKPIDDVFMLSSDTEINSVTKNLILSKGHSRVPIYASTNRNHICGVLITKYLIVVDDSEHKKVGDLPLQRPLFVDVDQSLLGMLCTFQASYSHLAVLTSDTDAAQAAAQSSTPPLDEHAPISIVTFEDVLERMLQTDIEDECDRGFLSAPLVMAAKAAGRKMRNLDHHTKVPTVGKDDSVVSLIRLKSESISSKPLGGVPVDEVEPTLTRKMSTKTHFSKRNSGDISSMSIRRGASLGSDRRPMPTTGRFNVASSPQNDNPILREMSESIDLYDDSGQRKPKALRALQVNPHLSTGKR
jgi:metal transporter CNNM